MKSVRLGIIRVMTLPETANRVFAQRIETLFPGIGTDVRCIADQPAGVHDAKTYQMAEPKIAAMTRRLETAGAAGILVNCAEDPGVALARRECRLPVFGAGSASALAAKAMGLPVGVIGLSGAAPPVMRDILGPQLVASVAPEGVSTALDLDGAQTAIIRAGEFLVGRGAGCLLLACTGMSLLGTAKDLRAALAVPIIDPLLSALTLAAYVLSGHPDFTD